MSGGGRFVPLAVLAHGGLLPDDRRAAALPQSLPVLFLRACAIVSSTAGIAALELLAVWRFRQNLRLLPLAVLMGLLLPLDAVTKLLLHRLRPGGGGLGFPSGHAMASLPAALLVAPLALAVAVGLVGRGRHWPNDIAGGCCWQRPTRAGSTPGAQAPSTP